MMDVYERLADKLDTLPVGFPRTDSGVELRILRRWFSEEEARAALKLGAIPEPVEVIAGRLGMTPEAVEPLLTRMAEKGNILRIRQGEEWRYFLVPMMEGMWELHLPEDNVEILGDVDEYLKEFIDKAWFETKATQRRIIPISEALEPDRAVLAYDAAEAIIKAETDIGITECVCRKQSRLIGHTECHHELERCIFFGRAVSHFVEVGRARRIDQAEALAILRKGIDEGLVLESGNSQVENSGICMCCSCGCVLLKGFKRAKNPAELALSNFFAEVRGDSCVACGECVPACPMEAIRLDETAIIERARCIGCGLCVRTCQVDAMHLKQKKERDRYTPPRDRIERAKRMLHECRVKGR